MKFSLINVISEKDGLVSGYFVQNHIGTLESASRAARNVESVNSNKITVAVVEEVSSPVPYLTRWDDLKRLDNSASRNKSYSGYDR